MPGPAGRTPRGLIQTTLADLEAALGERREEAEALRERGFHSTAVALRLYSLEIVVKIAICRRLRLPRLPAACKTHDLAELLFFTGAWHEIEDEAGQEVRKRWDVAVEYSRERLNDLRYEPRSKLTAEEVARIEEALDDPTHGVLAWLSRHM